jgi:hypothetical protein
LAATVCAYMLLGRQEPAYTILYCLSEVGIQETTGVGSSSIGVGIRSAKCD